MLEGAKMEASQRVCGVRVKALACGHAGEVKSPKKLEIEVRVVSSTLRCRSLIGEANDSAYDSLNTPPNIWTALGCDRNSRGPWVCFS
jgi:hypothetical protein